MAEHISKLIGAAGRNESATHSTKSPERISSATGLPIHWTSAILKKLQARYGHRWTAAIDGIEHCVVTEWSRGLAGLTGEQIKRGLYDWRG